MKNIITRSGIIAVLLLAFLIDGYSQAEKNPATLTLTGKKTDDQRNVMGKLVFSSGETEMPLPGVELNIIDNAGGDGILQSAKTDKNGEAVFTISPDIRVARDKEGLISFRVEFPGNDTVEAATAEISVRDVEIQMELTEVDSVKTINIKVIAYSGDEKVPVAGETISLAVPRMFSFLPVAELTLDENGSATTEFPSDIPGDKEGNLTIVARFVENPQFGNAESKTSTKWGVPVNYTTPTSHRALWTKTPPWWMIITLSILLAGVWGHYLFAVISLIRIKMDAKREKDKAEFKV